MRITIFAAGSRGDIQLCVMLGRGLQRAGFIEGGYGLGDEAP